VEHAALINPCWQPHNGTRGTRCRKTATEEDDATSTANNSR